MVQSGLIGLEATQHLKSDHLSLSLSLPQKTSGRVENSPAEFGGCETNTEIFLSVGFLACLSYLRTGWDISLIITRLGFSEKC